MIVYSKMNCPNCDIAKSLLALRGIKYIEVSLDSPGVVQDFKYSHPTVKALPFVTLDDGTVIGGLVKLRAYLKTLP